MHARAHTHICVWKNSTNLRLTLSPSAVRIIFGACVGEKWELRRARQKSRAKGAFACQWELIHLEKSGLKSPWEVKESQKSLSHSHSRLFLMFPLQFFIISPLFFNNPSVLTMSRAIGPVIAWKEHNSKVKLVRNGKKKQKKTFSCTTRDILMPLWTTIHKQGIWERNPALPGQVCNDLNGAAIATCFLSVINYHQRGWQSKEPFLILSPQQVALIYYGFGRVDIKWTAWRPV